MNTPSQRQAKGLRWFAVALLLVLLTLFKSASQKHHLGFYADEQYVVVRALGMLEHDFNPHWFKYQHLPMYVTSALYQGGYLVSRLLGNSEDKVDFVSGLYENEAAFYAPARLLFSLVYVLGSAIMAGLLYRRFRSLPGALAFLILANLLPDAMEAGNRIRTDTFAFTFSAAGIALIAFGSVTPRKALLASLCMTAAFASKFPALVLIPLFTLHLGWLVYRRKLPAWILPLHLLLVPLAFFLFMPYAFLDFEHYRPILEGISGTADGSPFEAYGYDARSSVLGRILYPWQALLLEVGWLPFVLFLALGLLAVIRQHELIWPYCYVGILFCTFITSAILLPYWLRSAYPWVLFFACWLVLDHAEPLRKRVAPGLTASRWHTLLFAGFAAVVLLFQSGGLRLWVKTLQTDQPDTRRIATAWIEENLPPQSRIYLEGHSVNYHPRVFSGDIKRDVNQFYNYYINRSYVLEKAFARWLEKRQGKPVFDVHLFDPSVHLSTWDLSTTSIPEGSYVIISSAIYERFDRPSVMIRAPEVVRQARDFYAYLHDQEAIKTFTGQGPSIKIFRMKEGLYLYKQRIKRAGPADSPH